VAEVVLAARADPGGARLLHEGPDWEVTDQLIAVGGQSFGVRGIHATYEDLYLPLFGRYAAANAAAGIVAVEALTGQALDEDTLREGLRSVRSPGRLEVVGHEPLVVLDGAHNPDGAAALAEAMSEFFTWERLHLVIAVSANKDLEGILAALAPIADAAYATRNDSVRSGDPLTVAEGLRALGTPTDIAGSVAEALRAARAEASSGDAILVTGSLFTVADAMRALGRG
jgi:dihydrofolate synthase/folylpolyglutamate synthase